jgi:WD40 repeat protein
MRILSLSQAIERIAVLTFVALSVGNPVLAKAAGRPDIVWFGTGAGVWGLATSPDDQTFVTYTAFEFALKMWRTDGTFVRTFGEYFTPYWTAAFSPDGQFLVAGREGIAGDTAATASIFRVSDGALMRGLNTGSQNNLYVVYRVDYSPSGDLVAVGYDNYSEGIKLYDPTNGQLVRSLPEGGYAVKFSPDGQSVVASRIGGPRLWRVSDGAVLHTFPPGGNLFSFSADGQYLAVGSGTTGWEVRIFRTTDGGLERTIIPNLVERAHSIEFAPDQNLLVVAGERDAEVPVVGHSSDEAIEAFDLNGDLVWSYSHSYGIAFQAGFSSHGQALMVGGGWDTPPVYIEGGFDTIQRLQASDGTEIAHFAGHRGLSYGVDFSPDSRLFVSGGNFTMQLWNVADGSVAHTFENGAVSVDISDDGTKLVAVAGGIQIWSMSDYALIRTLPGHNNGTNQAVISSDGTLIGSGGEDQNVKLWRVSDGALLWTRPSNAAAVDTVAFSPDGQILAGGCAGSRVGLWRTSDGMFLRSLNGIHAVDSIAFSPDGTLIAVAEQAYGNNLKLYRASDASLVRAFPGSQGFQHQSVTFTPDGSTIVFSSGAKFIQFWRVADGALLRQYDKEMGTGYFDWLPVAVSPDGRYFGYGRQDHMVVMARNPLHCAGDLNGDRQIDLSDLALLLAHFGTQSGGTLEDGDVDGDADVDLQDLASLLSVFGSACNN